MNKFTNDSQILSLQNKLRTVRMDRMEAEDTGCSESLILEIMDKEDVLIAELLKLGSHLRDC